MGETKITPVRKVGKKSTKSRLFPLLAAMLGGLVCGPLLSSSANGQPPEEMPKPVVRLLGTLFAYSFLKSNAVEAIVKQIAFTGNEVKANFHGQDKVEAKLTLSVQRTIWGKYVSNNQTLEITWWFPASWAQANGVDHLPEPGDAVFYMFNLNKDGLPGFGRQFSIAHPVEMKRLNEIEQILSREDPEQAARHIARGCQSPDPYFAQWCLMVMDQRQKVTSPKPYPALYGTIRQQFAPGDDLAMCWQLLKSPDTSSLVYRDVELRLAEETLGKQENEVRYQCHLRRFVRFFDLPLGSSPTQEQVRDEIICLEKSYYWGATNAQKKELVDTLARLAATEREAPYRWVAAQTPASLFDPAQQELAELVWGHYTSLTATRWNDRLIMAYTDNAIHRLMMRESKATGKHCSQGIELFRTILSLGEMQTGLSIVWELEQYANHCRKTQIDWPDRDATFSSLYKATPHAQVKSFFLMTFRRLGIEPTDETANL
ncbi:hypothetical protein AB1K70_19485 [Bremerella sp. JC770]|uniref:hypothetical protein n=1 Tax=Bremerella sp. JC770 TaxID=3232137 RepID=UPI003458A892